jgi:hypothetical protein
MAPYLRKVRFRDPLSEVIAKEGNLILSRWRAKSLGEDDTARQRPSGSWLAAENRRDHRRQNGAHDSSTSLREHKKARKLPWPVALRATREGFKGIFQTRDICTWTSSNRSTPHAPYLVVLSAVNQAV